MGRIKWNLDLLEEVKKQHGEAMTATEQVINNGKSEIVVVSAELFLLENSIKMMIQIAGLFIILMDFLFFK
jgi:hypothetical protein